MRSCTAACTHLFFNMFALYMFGPDIERLLGSQRFLTYYFVCVSAPPRTAAWCCTWWATRPCRPSVHRAASSACCWPMAWPFRRRKLMLMFPPIPMPAWLFVTLYGLLELYLGVSGSQAAWRISRTWAAWWVASR